MLPRIKCLFFSNPPEPILPFRILWMSTFLATFLTVTSLPSSHGMIGGRTALDGPFTIEDAEDLDLTADPLRRDWISDFVQSTEVLSAFDLTASGLTLAMGQSPTGALRATLPDDGCDEVTCGS